MPKVRDAFREKGKNKNVNRKQKHFYVSLKEIINNDYQLSFNQYKSFEPENQVYEDPKVLLERLLDMEKKILKEMEELTALLNL